MTAVFVIVVLFTRLGSLGRLAQDRGKEVLLKFSLPDHVIDHVP